MRKRRRILILAAGLIAAAGMGCTMTSNRMRLVNYVQPNQPEELYQNFSQGTFTKNSFGEYELLLENTEPIAQGESRILRQAIYATTIWDPIPGRTYAESSQINAKIMYIVDVDECEDSTVISQKSGKVLCYRGSGFISYQIDRTGNVLTGTIENAMLQPTHKYSHPRLGTFELSGNFRLVRDDAAISEFKISMKREK